MSSSDSIYENVQARHKKQTLELRQRKAEAALKASQPEIPPEPKVKPIRGFKGGDPVAIGKLGGRPKKGFEKNKKPPAPPPEPTLMEKQSDKKQRYHAAKLKNGGNMYQAALSVGYSEHMAKGACSKIETPDFRLAQEDYRARFAEKLRARIPDEKLIAKLEAGLEAKNTQFFSKDGLVIDSRDTIDFTETRKYADLILQNSERKTPERHEIDQRQTIDEGTMRRLADIAEKLGLPQMSPEERAELRRSYVVQEDHTINALPESTEPPKTPPDA